MWLRDSCISRSRSSSRLVSGTNVASPIRSATVRGRPPLPPVSIADFTRSLRFTTPTISSTLSPITGSRV
jgi:hypothetical protein